MSNKSSLQKSQKELHQILADELLNFDFTIKSANSHRIILTKKSKNTETQKYISDIYIDAAKKIPFGQNVKIKFHVILGIKQLTTTINICNNEQSRIKAFHNGKNVESTIVFSNNNIFQQDRAEYFNILLNSIITQNLQNLVLLESVAKSPLGFLYYGKLAKKSELAHHVFAQTVPEPYDIFIVEQLLENCNCFVDVGTNTGLYCFVAARFPQIKKIYAFEPQGDCVRQFKKTVSINNWDSKFIIKNCALGNKKTQLELELAGTGSSFNSNLISKNSRNKIIVPVSTLDTELNNKSCDFLKIDVEGFEMQVLLGAQKTIERCKPMIFVEINTKSKSETKHAYEKIDWLKSKGYILWEIRQLSAQITNKKWKPQENQVNMYLALHNEKHRNHILNISRYAHNALMRTLKYYLKLISSRFITKYKQIINKIVSGLNHRE